MRFKVEVIETRTVGCCYVVEADSQDEARELAQVGDTVDEWELTSIAVINREVENIEATEADEP